MKTPKVALRLKKNKSQMVRQVASYAVTLPERVLLSATSVLSGIFDAGSEVLFPTWLKKSTSYRVTLGLMHRFINHNIVGLEDADPLLNEAYLQRKTAGTVLEAAGLAIFRFSPIWFFAIISDAAGGSRVYLEHLSKQLIAKGLLDASHSNAQLNDLLEAIQNASNTTASVLDMPPLSKDEVGHVAKNILSSYAMTGEKAAQLLPDADEIWTSIKSLSAKGVSSDSIIGIMTLNATKSAVNATVDVLDQHILNSYRETLKQLQHEGPAEYIRRKMSPYLQASANHFSPKRVTWTEKGIKKAGNLHEWLHDKIKPTLANGTNKSSKIKRVPWIKRKETI